MTGNLLSIRINGMKQKKQKGAEIPFSFTDTADLQDRLDEEAKRNFRSRAAEIRILLREALDAREARREVVING